MKIIITCTTVIKSICQQNGIVFVKHGCPSSINKFKVLQNLQSPTFLPQPNPQGNVMSEKYKQPWYEITVQKHSTTFKGGTELHVHKDGQSNFQMHPAVDLSG